MKDNISLIAAAAGGLMLSIALSGLLRGTPMTSWQEQTSFRLDSAANLRVASWRSDEPVNYVLESRK